MIKQIILILSLLFLSGCGKVYLHKKDLGALEESDNVILGRMSIYVIPTKVPKGVNKKQDPLREISYLCRVNDINLADSPFYKVRYIPPNKKEYLGFFDHGLFAASSQGDIYIDKISCPYRNLTINGMGLSIKDIKGDKLNYVGDIRIYLSAKSDYSKARKIKSCTQGICTTSYDIKRFSVPKKISIRNNMKATFEEIKGLIGLPLDQEQLIYNQAKQRGSANVKFSKDNSELPF